MCQVRILIKVNLSVDSGQSYRLCYISVYEPTGAAANVFSERTILMDDFDHYRAEMNEKLLGSGHLGLKRFFALDTRAYEEGALDKKTKELMGLSCSIMLPYD